MFDASVFDSAPRLVVAILNYRTAKLTVDCLRSLVDEIAALPDTRVIVADNNSGDGSVEQIAGAIAQAGWQGWATVMPLAHNGGFASGNNAVVRAALQAAHPPAYVLLLNPDTVVRPGALTELVAFMEGHPDVGIAGSRLEDPDATPQRSAFRFHTLFSELDTGLRLGLLSRLLDRWVVAPPVAPAAHPTDWVAGASMIIRRGVFETIGLMDDEYFMYYEEMDFCLQAHRAGWPCWYVPTSRVVHLVGQSSGVTNTQQAPKRRPAYWFDSRRRYFLKNYGALYASMADLLWAVSFVLWRSRRRLQRKPDLDPPHFLLDFLQNSVFLKGMHINPPTCFSPQLAPEGDAKCR